MNLDHLAAECTAVGATCEAVDLAVVTALQITTGRIAIILFPNGDCHMATGDGQPFNVLDATEIAVMETICRHAARSRVELKAAA